MPIDLYVSRDGLKDSRRAALAHDLTEALLRWTDAAENDFLRSNISVFVHELPSECVYAGGQAANVARVNVKVPPIALTTQKRRAGFTADATALVRASAADQPFERVWVFISHAVEGGWGIDGVALTSDDMDA